MRGGGEVILTSVLPWLAPLRLRRAPGRSAAGGWALELAGTTREGATGRSSGQRREGGWEVVGGGGPRFSCKRCSVGQEEHMGRGREGRRRSREAPKLAGIGAGGSAERR
jgi:hypothetical protein